MKLEPVGGKERGESPLFNTPVFVRELYFYTS